MKAETRQYWGRIFTANVVASAIVLFVFSGATWQTSPAQLVRGFAIAFLFSSCIGPLLGVAMPRIAPWVWERLPFPFNWVAVSAAMVALAIAGSATAIGVLIIFGRVPAASFGDWFQGSLRIAVAVTLTMGLFITAYEVMRARVAQATAEAQLASLESRVQPHFLFNTLNSIAALIPDDPKGAERMTGQLASLLRASLDQQATPLVPLADELQTVRDYLAIERVRFGDRLRYNIQVDAPVTGARVPRLALQTLVENSVRHAVSTRREGATLRVHITPEPGAARIAVEDDGPGFDSAALPAGHGLALLRDRTALLFGDRGTLAIDGAPGRTRVSLTVPVPHDAAPAPDDARADGRQRGGAGSGF